MGPGEPRWGPELTACMLLHLCHTWPHQEFERSTMLGVAYPAYASYKTIRSKEPHPEVNQQMSQWLTYWAIWSTLTAAESMLPRRCACSGISKIASAAQVPDRHGSAAEEFAAVQQSSRLPSHQAGLPTLAPEQPLPGESNAVPHAWPSCRILLFIPRFRPQGLPCAQMLLHWLAAMRSALTLLLTAGGEALVCGGCRAFPDQARDTDRYLHQLYTEYSGTS